MQHLQKRNIQSFILFICLLFYFLALNIFYFFSILFIYFLNYFLWYFVPQIIIRLLFLNCCNTILGFAGHSPTPTVTVQQPNSLGPTHNSQTAKQYLIGGGPISFNSRFQAYSIYSYFCGPFGFVSTFKSFFSDRTMLLCNYSFL